MRMVRKWVAAALGTALLAGAGAFAVPGAALAAVQEGVGHEVTPGQPYGGVSRDRDWLGSYMLQGQHVWCVQFALTAPDSGQEYQPGDPLGTKWGDPLAPEIAANISYLLLRYGDTQSDHEAAALAHLLHSWTAAPRTPADLDSGNSFTEIAYDIDFHYDKLPAEAREAVERLRAEAEANRGPWEAELTAPEGEQTIGETAEWTLAVTRAEDQGVGGVPVRITATDAEVAGLTDGVATTPADGSPLVLEVTPTGPNPTITGELAAPADRPYVRQAVDAPDTTQRVVSTGGEQQLTVEATTTAVTAPGQVRITKVDEQSQARISGVALRLSLPDGSPALRQDGTPLVGPDGEPAVLTTGADGTAVIPDLKTPQEVMITEVSPAPGYEEAFDPANPPSVTGVLEPGQTLELVVSNVPNTPTVPIRIPAGDDPGVNLGLLGLGGMALVGAVAVGGYALRRPERQR
ncbi:MSCRAMM family protein [Saccharopolyspora sp. CA-218241]|uniref:MSCRAMM family protein n=1 Tax=Saccharopolyspora sp. CA-218241 TaxID=3240027 RepID=UPI003D982FFE